MSPSERAPRPTRKKEVRISGNDVSVKSVGTEADTSSSVKEKQQINVGGYQITVKDGGILHIGATPTSVPVRELSASPTPPAPASAHAPITPAAPAAQAAPAAHPAAVGPAPAPQAAPQGAPAAAPDNAPRPAQPKVPSELERLEEELAAARRNFALARAREEELRRGRRSFTERLREGMGAEPRENIGNQLQRSQAYLDAERTYRNLETQLEQRMLATPDGGSPTMEQREAWFNGKQREYGLFTQELRKINPPKQEGVMRRFLQWYATTPKPARILITAAIATGGVAAASAFMPAIGITSAGAGLAYAGRRIFGGVAATTAAEAVGKFRGASIERQFNEDRASLVLNLDPSNLRQEGDRVRQLLEQRRIRDKHTGWYKMATALAVGAGTSALVSLTEMSSAAHLAGTGPGGIPPHEPPGPGAPSGNAVPSIDDTAFEAHHPIEGAAAHAPGAGVAHPSVDPDAADAHVHDVFSDGAKVERGDSLWKILDRHFTNAHDPYYENLTQAQKNYVLDAYEKHLSATHTQEQLQALGFGHGNINDIQAGKVINLESLDDPKFASDTFAHAQGLSLAEQQNILNYHPHHDTILPQEKPSAGDSHPSVEDGAFEAHNPPPLPFADDRMLSAWANQNLGSSTLMDLFRGNRGVGSTAWQSIRGRAASEIINYPKGSNPFSLSAPTMSRLQESLISFAKNTRLDPRRVSVERLVRAGIALSQR